MGLEPGEGWHPRDIDTVVEHWEDQASEARLTAARQQLHQQMGG